MRTPLYPNALEKKIRNNEITSQINIKRAPLLYDLVMALQTSLG